MFECKECGGKLKTDKGQDPDGTYFTIISCTDCGIEPGPEPVEIDQKEVSFFGKKD